MNRKLHLVGLVLLSLILSACAGSKKDTGTVVPQEAAAPVVDSNAYGTGYSADQLAALGIDGNPLDYTTIYFEYNSTAIDERSNIIASAHARNLAANGGAAVTLEGHADERGTRDYNLALGERRAITVGQLMNAVGTGGSTISNVSYGEERPADSAHTESAWQKNRRVEIKY